MNAANTFTKLRALDITMPLAAFSFALLIAIQVASKATRDAFFLSQFHVSALPAMVIGASVLSIIAGFVSSRLNASIAPRRVLPAAFIAGAAILLMEWWMSTWNPMLAAVLAYLQMTVLGAILISGFWSLLDDRFDPRSAKEQFIKIVGAGTLGGVIGGFLAARIGAGIGVTTMLPALAILHVVSGILATRLGHAKRAAAPALATAPPRTAPASGLAVLRTAPYVRNLARVILASTMGAVLLDFVFKARVAAAYSTGDELVGFFALFYTVVGVGTFLAQVILSRIAVDRLGIAGTVSSLPLSLALGSLGAIILPGLPTAFAMRGGESMVRSSLFKSSYEMLFAAVPKKERAASKSILDVGVERLGDLLGAVLLGGISWIVSADSTNIVLSFAASLGLVGFSFSRRLQTGYVQALENNLLSRSMALTRTHDHTFDRTMTFVFRPTTSSGRAAVKPAISDLSVQLLQDLRSPDAETVRRTLSREDLDNILAPSIIALLAWNDVMPDAVAALKRMGPRITGQLVDALVDPDEDFVVRRRLPRVLAELDSQLAADGLIQALSDTRFEVRYRAARALTQIKKRNPRIMIRRESITEAVEREMPNNFREPCPDLTVDHVFGLLELVYPREVFHAAHRALKSDDVHLRQTSLEYLENVLPASLWERMLPLFEKEATFVPAV